MNSLGQNISDFQMTRHLFDKIDSPCYANYTLKKSTADNVDLNRSVIKAIENDFYLKYFTSNI